MASRVPAPPKASADHANAFSQDFLKQSQNDAKASGACLSV